MRTHHDGKDQLSELFYPDRPIDDENALFGRQSQLRRVLLDLWATERGVPVLVGPPGIGKTSLLRVLQRVLVGDRSPLANLSLEDSAPEAKNRLVVYVRCERGMKDEETLSRAISERISQALQVPEGRPKPRWRVKSFDIEANAHLIGAKASWVPTGDGPYLEGLLSSLENLIFTRSCDEIVFLLDECEQLTWIENLLDYTREFEERAQCRFILAVRDYAADHLSDPQNGDYRWPNWIEVTPLTRPQVRELFVRVQKILEPLGVGWDLTTECLHAILAHSAGEPWFIQMVGYELVFDEHIRLEAVIRRGSSSPAVTIRVGLPELKRAEDAVLRSRLRNLHGRKYRRLTSKSAEAEELLRSMARYPESFIPAEFVHHIGERRLAQAQSLVDALSSNAELPLIFLEDQGGYHFRDHQFRVFCRLSQASDPLIDEFARTHIESFSD